MKPKYETVRKFAYKGYKLIIKRNTLLNYLLGYVMLPKGHRYYGITREDIPVECHGDLTYGKFEGDYYVIGFDCAHSFDFNNNLKKSFNADQVDSHNILGEPNKDETYVMQQLKGIVDQLQK